MGRSVKGLFGAGILVVSLMAPSPALAAPRPPDVAFVTRSDSSSAFLRTYCWAEYDPPFIYQECTGGVLPIPPGRRVEGLDSAHIRIDHPQEPDSLKVFYWKGPAWQRPQGARQLEVAPPRPVVADGGGAVSWRLDFELPEKWKRLSLEIRASWETEFSCPTCGRQWGEWRVTLIK